MTRAELITTNKEVLVTMINKMLDALYEGADEQTTESSKKYETLRRKVLNGDELENTDLVLLSLIVSYHCNKLIELSHIYTQTANSLADILEHINNFLQESNEKIESQIIDFPTNL